MTDDDPIPPHSFSGGIGAVDPDSGRIVGTIVFTDRTPSDVAVTRQGVWFSTGTLTRVDPSTMRVTDTIRLDGEVGAISARGSAVWAAVGGGSEGSFIAKVDDRTGKVLSKISIPDVVEEIIATEGGIWALLHHSNGLVKIDPSTNAIVARTELASPAFGLAVGAGAVWVSDYRGGVIRRIDPVSLRVTSEISPGPWPADFIVNEGSLWVTNYVAQQLRRIDL